MKASESIFFSTVLFCSGHAFVHIPNAYNCRSGHQIDLLQCREICKSNRLGTFLRANKKKDDNWGERLKLSPPPTAETTASKIPTAASAALSSTADNGRAIWIARITLITVSAFYGTNFGCVKILNDSLNPSVAALLRFTLAALVFLPKVIKTVKSNPKLVLGGLECGMYNALGYCSQAVALSTASASTAAFICSLAVVVVPFLDTLFPSASHSTPVDSSKEFSLASATASGSGSAKSTNKAGDFPFSKFVPAILATIGVGCLELGGTYLPGIGDLWAIGQPVFFGLAFWRAEKFMRVSKVKGEAQAFTGSMMISVCLFSLLWSLTSFLGPLLGDMNAVQAAVATQMGAFSDWHVPAAILWTGIVTTALTAFGENMAMQSLSAAESTVIFSTEPLWGTAFAAVALGEQVGWNTGVGAVFILSACLWSSLGPFNPFAAAPMALVGEDVEFTEGILKTLENIATNWAQFIERLSPPPVDFP